AEIVEGSWTVSTGPGAAGHWPYAVRRLTASTASRSVQPVPSELPVEDDVTVMVVAPAVPAMHRMHAAQAWRCIFIGLPPASGIGPSASLPANALRPGRLTGSDSRADP